MVSYAKQGSQYNQYKQQNAMTASPGELTLMLYDGCIKHLKLSKMHIEGKDLIKANESSQRAQEIIIELMRTVDTQYEIGKQLIQLYGFMLDTMIKANLKKDPLALDPALELLAELRDTWQQAVRLNRKQVFGDGSSI